MQFQREKITVNGVETVMLTAGEGEPLLFLHGAGTFTGFDFALPWASKFRLLIPYHPNWGESGDAPHLDRIEDYTMHYIEFIDQMGFLKVNVVGLSMGGRMAATFAYKHRRRVNKLVLVAPAGIDVPDYEMVDFAKIPPDQIFGYLAENQDVILRKIPAEPSAEWLATREREGASFATVVKNGLAHPKWQRWLHRLTMPTLVVWGENDRALPIQQADAWMKALPNAKLLRYPGAGHLLLDEKPQAVQDIAEFLSA